VARRRTRTLTEVELEFMQVVWSADGEVGTEDVQEALAEQGRDLSGGSVRKVLSILMDKGYLTRRREGRGFVYKARVPEEKANRNMLGDLLKRAFGGSAALMVATLLEGGNVSRRELKEIKRLIAEREEGRR
jgi:predicted transcriptional regulator